MTTPAIHLCQILSGMTDAEAIGRRLAQDPKHPAPIFRRNAAVAYGWEGDSGVGDLHSRAQNSDGLERNA